MPSSFSSRVFTFIVEHLNSILFAIFMWLVLIARYGYTFGVGDQVELLPYVLFLKNHALYPHDFFIQGLNSVVPNERTVMAYLLLPFSACLQLACIVLHFFCTVSLIFGMENIASRFISNKLIARAAIFISFVPFYNWTLGDVELYYNCFQASNLAKAIGIWAVVSFLDERFLRTYILVAITTFIQFIVGIDLVIVLSLVLLLRYFIHADIKRSDILKSFGVYALTAGLYVLVSFFVRPKVGAGGDYFDIMFLFRHPHHYIFSAFPLLKRIVFLIFMLVATYYFSKKNRTLFYFITISCLILVINIVCVDLLHLTFVANFQWFKMTIWLKFFGVLAIIALISDRLGLNSMVTLSPRKWTALGLSTGIAFMIALIFWFNYLLPFQTSYHFGRQTDTDPLISICSQIKNHTPLDAVFIQPFEVTELKYYAQRSSFVEFKANIRDPKHAAEWYQRIQLVYGVSIGDKQKGFGLQQKADHFYEDQTAVDYEALKSFGVTHVLTYANVNIPGKVAILENDFYKVYEL